jgi:hypothetical protein
MTPQEIQAAVKALRDEIGPKCELSLYVNGKNALKPIDGHCRPRGYGADSPFISTGCHEGWLDALDDCRQQWLAMKADIEKDVLRRMALAIIRITADTGACTNAALRADDFTEQDIAEFGDAACQQADEMASNGPFTIAVLQGANAA